MADILLIDDDEQVSRMLTIVLQRAGHRVDAACDGVEAMKYFNRHRPQIVITDLFMDRKEGIETIIEMRQTYPDIPIIAISGGGWGQPEEYLSIARKLGAARSLAKPFPNDELLRQVDELVPPTQD